MLINNARQITMDSSEKSQDYLFLSTYISGSFIFRNFINCKHTSD